ncbi:hypothetical protein BDK51DRAFT_29391, partial [Blyttiomyces helicus]
MLVEQVNCWTMWGRRSAIQIGPNKLLVHGEKQNVLEMPLDQRIKGVAITKSHLAAWTGTEVQVFEFTDDPQSLYICTDSRMDICNHTGSIRQSLTLHEGEGEITYLTCSLSLLIMITSRNYFKLYDSSKRDPRLVVSRAVD